MDESDYDSSIQDWMKKSTRILGIDGSPDSADPQVLRQETAFRFTHPQLKPRARETGEKGESIAPPIKITKWYKMPKIGTQAGKKYSFPPENLNCAD